MPTPTAHQDRDPSPTRRSTRSRPSKAKPAAQPRSSERGASPRRPRPDRTRSRPRRPANDAKAAASPTWPPPRSLLFFSFFPQVGHATATSPARRPRPTAHGRLVSPTRRRAGGGRRGDRYLWRRRDRSGTPDHRARAGVRRAGA